MSLSTITFDGAQAPAAFNHPDRLLRLSQVMNIVAFSRSHIYGMIRAGKFPAPCNPFGTASRWSENEVLAWLAECTSQRMH